MQKITTFLTFKDRGEEAVRFYVDTFKNSSIESMYICGDDDPLPKGTMLNAQFTLDGQKFMAMEAGPKFTFEQGFSLYVNCDDQAEIDYLWDRLSEGGESQMCGWLKDKYGVSWQIIPSVLGPLMGSPDPEKSQRVMQALLQMTKMDIKGLQDAHDHAP